MSAKKQLYKWQGTSNDEKRICGKIYGFSEDDVLQKLHEQKIQPCAITSHVPGLSFNFSLARKQKVKSNTITSFVRMFADLLHANIPLIMALDFMVSDDDINTSLKPIIKSVKSDVEHGQPLSKAFGKYPQYFDLLFCNLLCVGEQSGKLDTVLKHIATYMEKRETQKRKVIKALFYPLTVLAIAIIVTSILLIFVVPQFQEMFANFGAKLPAYTQMVINLAKFMQSYGLVIFGIFVAIFIALKYCVKKIPLIAQKFDLLKLKIPFFGSILQKNIIYNFAKILAITFKSGMSILEALSISAGICNNYVYEKAIKEVREKVAHGYALVKAMREFNIFPKKVINFIAIGEESGQLDDMLEEIARNYEAEVNYVIENLNNLLEPLIMLILGVLVGGVVIAMYLPIFRLGTAL
jgi:type IV pilus assembly protein PilC